MGAVNHIGYGRYLSSVAQPQSAFDLQVNVGYQFACAQVFKNVLAIICSNVKSHAPAGAAAVEAKDQARSFFRSAMNPGIDTERTVDPVHCGLNRFYRVKSRSPHQRTIAKNPKIAHR